MHWIRKSAIYALIVLVTVLFFDGVSYFFLKEHIRKINSFYGSPSQGLSPAHRGYPQHHFEPRSDRGFDIAPGSRGISNKPKEAEPYEVWGNSLGCFDTELDTVEKPDIYLAGDSFTWGYAPFEKKFGTLLQHITEYRVLKCGVSHTGQLHQLSKFVEIFSRLVNKPRLVIVNYVSNDIANDWAFPHSTVVDGYLVETIRALELNDGSYQRQVDSKAETREKYDEWKLDAEHVTVLEKTQNLLRQYSAFAILVNEVVESLIGSPDAGPSGEGVAIRSFYSLIPRGEIPISHTIAAKNRNALVAWQRHSVENSYELIISIIPERDRMSRGDSLDEFKLFLSQNNLAYWDPLEDGSLGHFTEGHYWPVDGHLNVEGNALYAEFLASQIASLDF